MSMTSTAFLALALFPVALPPHQPWSNADAARADVRPDRAVTDEPSAAGRPDLDARRRDRAA